MGIIAVRHKNPVSNCRNDVYSGLYGINHMGQVRCGVAFYDGNNIEAVDNRGLVRTLQLPSGMGGFCGVGAVGTTLDHQPVILHSPKLGKYVVVFDGVILNAADLRKKVGGAFSTNSDPELAARMIAEGKDFMDGIEVLANEIKGPYCISVIGGGGDVYAARCPMATRPLVFGQDDRGYIAISESRSVEKIKMPLIRDFGPGEVMHFTEGVETVTIKVDGKERKICSFLPGYFSWVDCVVDGIPVNVAREQCGAILARHDREEDVKVDVAIPVPDSGKAYAEGYAFEYECFHSDGLIKYPYWERSYTQMTQEQRDRVAAMKLSAIRSRVEGKSIAVCDDSIRRGTQLKKGPLRLLKECHPKEIHVRIGTPKNHAYCRFDPQTLGADDAELFANTYPDERAMAKALEVDSVRFVADDEFAGVLSDLSGLTADDFCMGCYGGDFSFLA